MEQIWLSSTADSSQSFASQLYFMMTLENGCQGLERRSTVRSTCCSSRQPNFRSQSSHQQPSPTPAPGVLKPLVSAGVCTQCTNSYADTHTSTDNYKYFFKKLKENCFSWKNKRLYPAVLRSSSHYLSSQSESEVQMWNQSPREWSSRDIQNSWVRDFSGTRVSQREDTSKWNWGSDHCSRERVYKQASL